MADEVEKQESAPLEGAPQKETPQEEELAWSETPVDLPEEILPEEEKPKKKRFSFALMLVLTAVATAAVAFAALVLLDMKNVSGEDVLRKTVKASKDPEASDPVSPDPSDSPAKNPSQTPNPSQEQDPLQSGNMNTAETVEYLRSHSPSALGLPGESMDVYKITSDRSTFVVDENGERILCKVLMVYQVDEKVGTNTFIGEFLVSCRSDHTIYRRDASSGAVAVAVRGSG